MALRPASSSATTWACSPRKSSWPKVRRSTLRAASRLESGMGGVMTPDARPGQMRRPQNSTRGFMIPCGSNADRMARINATSWGAL